MFYWSSLSLLAQQQVCRTSHAADASWNELVYLLLTGVLFVIYNRIVELLKDSVSSILVDDIVSLFAADVYGHYLTT